MTFGVAQVKPYLPGLPTMPGSGGIVHNLTEEAHCFPLGAVPEEEALYFVIPGQVNSPSDYSSFGIENMSDEEIESIAPVFTKKALHALPLDAQARITAFVHGKKFDLSTISNRVLAQLHIIGLLGYVHSDESLIWYIPEKQRSDTALNDLKVAYFDWLGTPRPHVEEMARAGLEAYQAPIRAQRLKRLTAKFGQCLSDYESEVQKYLADCEAEQNIRWQYNFMTGKNGGISPSEYERIMAVFGKEYHDYVWLRKEAKQILIRGLKARLVELSLPPEKQIERKARKEKRLARIAAKPEKDKLAQERLELRKETQLRREQLLKRIYGETE